MTDFFCDSTSGHWSCNACKMFRLIRKARDDLRSHAGVCNWKNVSVVEMCSFNVRCHFYLQQIVIEAMTFMYQIHRSFGYNRRPIFIQNDTMQYGSTQHWHPIVWNAFFIRRSLLETFHHTFSTPNALVMFWRIHNWYRYILHGICYASQLVSFPWAFLRYIMNCCRLCLPFVVEF